MAKCMSGTLRYEYSKLVDEGDAERRLFRFENSFKTLNEAIQLDPNHFEAWYKKALVYWTKQNHIETSRHLKISLSCNPTEYWRNVLQGFIHELNHRVAEAQQFYLRAVQYINDNNNKNDLESGMEAYLNLGFVELDLHNFLGAIEMFKKALAKQEEYHDRIDKLEKIQKNKIMIRKPALIATCYNNIGHTYVHMGEDTTAIQFFTKAIDIFDRDLFFLKNRIKAYSRLNMYKEVIQDCNRAIGLRITDSQTLCEVYSFRGSAYYNLNRVEEAMIDFKIANQTFPHYHYPYVMLSYIALISNRMEEASAIIDEGIEKCSRTCGLQALYSFRLSYLTKNDDQLYRKRLKAMDGDVLARIS